jgi:hypothetical protein
VIQKNGKRKEEKTENIVKNKKKSCKTRGQNKNMNQNMRNQQEKRPKCNQEVASCKLVEEINNKNNKIKVSDEGD